VKHLYLQVNAGSPLTIRSDHAQEGASTTQYIPGATLLGSLAAAHRMLRPEMDNEFTRLFLNEQVYIPYLYPAVFNESEAGIDKSNLPVMPLPKTAQSCKRFSGFKPLPGELTHEKRHGIRDSLLDWAIFSLLNDERQAIPALLAPLKTHTTCKHDNCQQAMDHVAGYYRCARPDPRHDATQRMKAKIHTHLQTRTGINRSWGVVEESILYNREVFDEDMRFWGEVIFPNEPDEPYTPNEPYTSSNPNSLVSIFAAFVEEAEKEDVIRVGTGRTRGLGRVSIKVFDGKRQELASFRKKLVNFDATLQKQAQEADVQALDSFYFAITLNSPTILCDTFLRYRTTLDAATLVRLLERPDDRFTRIYQATTTQRITGWNELWGTPRTNDHALEMGSTFLFACSHMLDDELLQALYTLEETGLGQRRTEGFGRICISDPFHLEGEQV